MMGILRHVVFWDCDECRTRFDSSQIPQMQFAKIELPSGEERQICYPCLIRQLPGLAILLHNDPDY